VAEHQEAQRQKLEALTQQPAEVQPTKEPPLTNANSTIRGTRAPTKERVQIQIPKEARRLVVWVLAIVMVVVLIMAFAPSLEDPAESTPGVSAVGRNEISIDGNKGWGLASEGHRSRTMHHKRVAQQRQRQRHKKKYKNRSAHQRQKSRKR
jgi:hypothetical protein